MSIKTSKPQGKENNKENVSVNKENMMSAQNQEDASKAAAAAKNKRLPKNKRKKQGQEQQPAAKSPTAPQPVVIHEDSASSDESSADEGFVGGSRFAAAFAGNKGAKPAKKQALVEATTTTAQAPAQKFVKNSKANKQKMEDAFTAKDMTDSEDSDEESIPQQVVQESVQVMKLQNAKQESSKTKSPAEGDKNKGPKGGPKNAFAALLSDGGADDSSDEESSEDEAPQKAREVDVILPPTYTSTETDGFQTKPRRFKKPSGKGNELTKV